MEVIAHKRIHNFDFEGIIADEKDIIRLRQQYEAIAEEYMRAKGYIPHYDLDPVFTIEYTTQGFKFKYTRYGVYVGKAKSRCYQAIVGTKMMPMTLTQQLKSEKSLGNAVSP
jgi:hypothetical protein